MTKIIIQQVLIYYTHILKRKIQQMKINPISFNNTYKAQNFKGIISRVSDEKVVDEMTGGNKEILDKLTDTKGIDIYIFDWAYNEKDEKVPAYAWILHEKDNPNKNSGLVGVRREQTPEGMKDAKERLEKAIVWANAPANMFANAAIGELGKDEAQKAYVKHLQEDMSRAYFANEAKVWKQQLDIIVS